MTDKKKLFEFLDDNVYDIELKDCNKVGTSEKLEVLADRICDVLSKDHTEKHGKWNMEQFVMPLSDGSKTAFNCSKCNTTWDYATAYCPNCGAEMDLR